MDPLVKKVETVTVNQLKYVNRNGVLFRIKGQSVPYTFDSEEYSSLNMPRLYFKFTSVELVARVSYFAEKYKIAEADRLTLINKVNEVFTQLYPFISSGNYTYIIKRNMRELGNAIACTMLNEIFLKGNHPAYYTNSFQFIQAAISKNMDYFNYVRNADCLIIDTLDEFANTPPLYKKDTFYQIKSTIYSRSIKKKPTIIVSSSPPSTLPGLFGVEIASYIINNLFMEMEV